VEVISLQWLRSLDVVDNRFNFSIEDSPESIAHKGPAIMPITYRKNIELFMKNILLKRNNINVKAQSKNI